MTTEFEIRHYNNEQPPIRGRIVAEPHGSLGVYFEGYGNETMENGFAAACFFEVGDDGHPVLYIFEDYANESETRKISFANAREPSGDVQVRADGGPSLDAAQARDGADRGSGSTGNTEGYGNETMENGFAAACFFEVGDDGHPVLYIFEDYANESETRKISFANAREPSGDVQVRADGGPSLDAAQARDGADRGSGSTGNTPDNTAAGPR